MKRILLSLFALVMFGSVHAKTITLTVKTTHRQTVTGFGAACCDGAMRPYGTDKKPAQLLYGPTSKVGLNILRVEISPSFNGDDGASWGSTYNWEGGVPSAQVVKQRGGIVFGTPWSPPGDFKTNGTAQGGNSEDQGWQRGELREDCYEKFFPWLNSYLKYMKSRGVKVDAVSVQNEPDWWVNYSGCLYTPQQQLNLVKNYAHMLDRETYSGVRLISAEPLGFDPRYSNMLLNDKTAREQIDIIAGHIYGHAPLLNGNLKDAAVLAAKYGKEVWMTEHSSTDNIGERLPTWHEQLLFAEELNECMLAGCTGYIYWYMRAHWAFVSTGEAKYGAANKTKNRLLPRAYVMAHFAKNVTGSTRLETSLDMTSGTEAEREYSAYIKDDSLLIVMAIDTTAENSTLRLRLPYLVKGGKHILSTGNETTELCQESEIVLEEPTKTFLVDMPARSLNTYVLVIDNEATAITTPEMATAKSAKSQFYDLQGRPMPEPRGLCIERRADGTSRKVYLGPRGRVISVK
jgi:glucuronoarabinoxylan endo-1,4-beta-xylanase